MNKISTGFKKATRRLQRFLLIWMVACISIISVSGNAWAVEEVAEPTSLTIPDVPLFVSLNAVPNVFFEMDDSGSMDWTILAPVHFTACRYDARLDCDTETRSGVMRDYTGDDDEFRDFEYVFSADDDAYDTGCTDDRNVLELCDRREDDWDWRIKSAGLNVLYFNPYNDYEPWPGYTSAAFGGARSYPDPELDGYDDVRNMNGFIYHHWMDTHGFSGTKPNLDDRTDGPNEIVDQWDNHVKVTVNSGSYSCDLVTYDPDDNSNGIDPKISPIDTDDSRCKAALGQNKNLEMLQKSIANWYQYYRRRTMVARAGVATVISKEPGFRYGFGMINDQDLFVEMPDADVTNFAAHNEALVEKYLEYQQEAHGTPLRRGLERVGRYYEGELSGKDTPIVETCQKNFSILFSDGFWNGDNPSYIDYDVDKDGSTISESKVLLADVAKYYYDTDLSSFPDVVPTDPFDTASHQHMVTFTIGFGVTGGLVDTDGNGWPNPPLASDDQWHVDDSSTDARKVDDLWHAAWNSRGKYISAKRPEDLVRGVQDALNNISDRTGSAASGSANGGSISNDSKIFQAKFDASDWHGELLALNVDPNSGTLGEVAWEAGNLLNARSASGRSIFTTSDSGKGINFSWSAVSDSVSAAQMLNVNPDSNEVDDRGEDRLNYIRGSDTDEGTGADDFRQRNHKLGDLGHSNPEYAGAPPFFYSFDDYMSFANTNKNRQTAVYVGGNDGMLHAFAEDTGEELFAFVPNYVIGELNKLTDPLYQHQFYVDGSPTYGDVFYNNSWKSVLAGSLRSGGQAVYALDVTNPATFEADDILWEFTDADDADLGYVYGQPQIKQMQNGKWAVIFTSGYNNTEADDHVSTDGAAYIFVLFIREGIDGWSTGDYVKIPVPGADGLAEPAVADVDADNKADFIYVGDLAGQMWKIDVTDKSPSRWGVAFSGNPLFTAVSPGDEVQAITTRPAIKRHPLGIQNGVLVLFGTGRYLELADDTTIGIPTQSVYSIWDRDGYYNGQNDPPLRNDYGDYGFNRSTKLVNPSMEVDSQSGTRIIDPSGSSTPIWFNPDGTPKDRGWVLDMPLDGERVVREIVLRDDLAFFVTLIPEDDVCSAGGTGWLMAVNSTTGSALWFPVFDINDDDLVTDSDVVGSQVDGEDPNNPVGISSLSIPNLPVFVFDDRPFDSTGTPLQVFPPTANSSRGCGGEGARSYSYTTQTNGSVTMITTAAQPLSCGRQSWRQIK